MNVINLEDSDSSDDIFIVKQVKPVNKLTLQQALIIKYGVLHSLNSKKNKKKKKRKERSSSNSATLKQSKEQVVQTENSTEQSVNVGYEEGSQTKTSKGMSTKRTRSNTRNVKDCMKQNSQEKETQQFLDSSIEKKVKHIDIPSNEVDNCVHFNVENQEKLPSSISKRRKLKEIETNHNRELEPEMADASGGNKNALVEDLFKSSSVDNVVKYEIKVEESVDILENDIFGSEIKSEELTAEFSIGFPSELNQDNLIGAVNAFERLGEETFKSNSKLLSFLLKKIICNETKKQIYLEQYGKDTGQVVEKLLPETDCQVLEKFFKLNESASQIFVRMLGRKKCWHRVSSINYNDISDNLESEFLILNKENFIDLNIEDEDLKTQMNLLSKPEVSQLCKAFNMPFKPNGSYKKEELINLLVQDTKKQKSISDMFKKKSSANDRSDLLRLQVKKYLGMCVKLSDTAYEAFYKIFLLHSFPHYTEEEDKRFSNELYLSLQVHRNFIRFPNYELSPTVVFETRSDFDEYKKALLLYNSFEISINSKNLDEFVSTFKTAEKEFKKLLKNTEYQKRFLNLKPFLRKFSAGTVYARILSRYCTTFKKKLCNSEKITVAQLLLDQNLFLIRKKGEWYETLSKALENEKNYQAAAEVIIKSLEDPFVSEVQKLTLQLRGQLILKKKNSEIIDIKLREVLDDVCTLSIQEPPSIEIKGKAFGEGKVATKSIYVQECKNGKIYTSVEGRAISYYKSNGFTKGYHAEGSIVQSIYFLLFYDLIYGTSVQGVFQSSYQEAPLDFYSSSFYDNRKEQIELLLGDIISWSDEELEARIKEVYNRNYRTTCIIKWDDEFTPELFLEIIKCITLPILVLILQKLIRNFKVYRSGFPDLTLWNPETGKCKFVEVKSPNDRLSPGQRVWLDYLRNIGLDCEVCNVKNISGKSFS